MQITNGLDVQVIKKRTEAERKREYRNRMGPALRTREAKRMRGARAAAIPEFVGVDSEGIGKGSRHRAVVLSTYDKHGIGAHYIARDVSKGLLWDEVFGFLYSQFQAFPRAAFVGFFLGYDFNNWLCYRANFPEKAAHSLLTKAGKAARKLPQVKGRSKYRPVKVERWEVDMLGFKRLSIRPRPEGCYCYESAMKCSHKQLPWMHICDAGSFFQMSFLNVIDPELWKDDPEGWPITQEMYDRILYGKNNLRVDQTRVTRKLLEYNRDENIALALVMERLAKGFAAVGIKIAKDQWYGPGATASKWLMLKGAPKRAQLRQKGKSGTKPLMPKWFWDVCHYSYFGGWFEIFSHGLIQGDSYNYDINNAYPFAATKLPHICGESGFRRGQGDYDGTGEYVLLYATVFTRGDRIGAVPYREKDGTILRPRVSKGWYWKHEIEAAQRAGLVKKVMTNEWAEFLPCSHSHPLSELEDLYNLRLKVGKNSAQGMAIKLNNNSVYGKFAQSVGAAPFGNWFYASYITSHCRTQILDAIATHPDKADAVLMVATDGICFDSPHPGLPISKRLGQWDYSVYTDLVLFKPGVYWHKQGKDRLLKVKSRGVPKEAFLAACLQAEDMFKVFSDNEVPPEFTMEKYDNEVDEQLGIFWTMEKVNIWPWFSIPVTFRMRTCLSALSQNNWKGSAEVLEEIHLKQDSDPQSKRRQPFWNSAKKRIDTVIHELPIKQLHTHYHGQVEIPKPLAIGFNLDGTTAFGPILEAAAALRESAINYDLPLTVGYENNSDYEWETVWG